MTRTILGPRRIAVSFNAILLALSLVIAACDRPVGSERLVAIGQPRESPSGNFSLALDEKGGGGSHRYAVSIHDGTGAVVLACPGKFFTRHTLFLCWADGEDIAWCYSGDLGAFFWARDAAGAWREGIYEVGVDGGGAEPPDVLKKLRPSFFSARKG
jgi:hypothetical protein